MRMDYCADFSHHSTIFGGRGHVGRGGGILEPKLILKRYYDASRAL